MAATLGITGSPVVRIQPDGLNVCSLGGGGLQLSASRATEVSLHDMTGRLLKVLKLTAGEELVLALKSGLYLVNGQKVMVN